MRAVTLVQLTLAYLAFPQLLFLPTWLNGWIGFPVTALIAGAVAWSLQIVVRARSDAKEVETLARGAVMVAIAVGLLMTLVSGASGVVHQTWDWEKHNAVLLDLARYEWPVVYEFAEGDRFYLLYYLSYYLPGAAAAKVAGPAAAQAVLFGWTALGTTLAAMWFGLLVRHRAAVAIATFPFLGGLDAFGHWILHGGLPAWFQNLEAWLRGYVNFSTLVLHVWSPQHALAAWLGLPLILHCSRLSGGRAIALLAWAFTLFWSPLVAVGLGVVLGRVLLRGESAPTALRDLFAKQSLLPLAAAVATVAVGWLFLLNGAMGIPLSWLWQYESLAEFWPKLLLFYAIEFGLVALLVKSTALDRERRGLLVLAALLLLVAPWLRFGLYNDLAARLAHVGQYLLWVVALGWLGTAGFRSPRAALLLGCVLLGSWPALSQLRFIFRATALNPNPVRASTPVPHLQPAAAAAQYLGRTDTWKWRMIAPGDTHVARISPLPGEGQRPFTSPLLLANFRGQGVERDESGWWMWNRGELELTFRVREPEIVTARSQFRIKFEAISAGRDRALTLRCKGTTGTDVTEIAAQTGTWTTVEVTPLVLERDELTLLFALVEPEPNDRQDPHQREFAIKNIRFEVLPPADLPR